MLLARKHVGKIINSGKTVILVVEAPHCQKFIQIINPVVSVIILTPKSPRLVVDYRQFLKLPQSRQIFRGYFRHYFVMEIHLKQLALLDALIAETSLFRPSPKAPQKARVRDPPSRLENPVRNTSELDFDSDASRSDLVDLVAPVDNRSNEQVISGAIQIEEPPSTKPSNPTPLGAADSAKFDRRILKNLKFVPVKKRRNEPIETVYGTDFTAIMESIRSEKRAPLTIGELASPAKRPRRETTIGGSLNVNLKSNSVLLEQLKRNLKNETQMINVNSLRILQLNVRTLTHKKLPYVTELLALHKPEVVMFNEYGVDENCQVFPRIKSYHLVSYELKSTFSGVAIYVQASAMEAIQLISADHKMKMAQICGIKVKDIKIFNVYRSPSMKRGEEEMFCEWISNLDPSNVIIIGDLNLHVSWDDYISPNSGHQMIASEFLEGGFCQYQYGVTFEQSNRTLDVTLCNNFETVMSCTTDSYFKAPAIDHVPTITDIVMSVELVEEKEIRLWKKRDKEKYSALVVKELEALQELFGEMSFADLDLDEMDSRLSDALLNAEDLTVPKVVSKPREIQSGTVNSMSEKTKKLNTQMRELRKKGKHTQANKMQAVIRDSLEVDRQRWSLTYVKKMSRDRNLLWKIYKESQAPSNSTGPLKREDGTLTFHRKEKVSLVNSRYKSVMTEKTHPTCNVEDLESCKTKPGFSDVTFKPGDIFWALKKSNNSTAKDSRGLSMPLFREVAEILAEYLCTMFNLSVTNAKLAAVWLLAMIIPIPKGGDLSLPKQWRPVVLEQTPLRILEAAFNFKFVTYLELRRLLHFRQKGFRRGHSTVHNLLEFWQHVVYVMKKHGRADVIYADTSAAFDRLSHGILLDKLFHEFGVYGTAWYFLKAWTTDRKQFVYWNGESSETVEVTSSCMQGSALGTTLWNCYFNEVCHKLDEWIAELDLEDAAFFVYADDLKLIFVPTPENTWKINVLLEKLQNKMEELKLKFNATKCHVLTLGNIKNRRYDVIMKNEEGSPEVLVRSNVERDLGIQIDSDGTFETQIKKSIGIAKASSKILSRIFKKSDFITKVQLYEAHIFSRLSYASEVWFHLRETNPRDKKFIEEMNKIYVDFFKFACVPANRYPPLVPQQALLEKDLLMLFKIFNDLTPLPKGDFFDLTMEEPRTRSQTQCRISTEKWERWQATTLVTRNKELWNKIPLDIRSSGNLESFQAYVRTEVLEKMPCNSIRVDMMTGDLRKRAKLAEKKTEKALFYSKMNKEIGVPSGTRAEDFFIHEDYRDDFMKSDVCFKLMSRRTKNVMEKIKKQAPWMALCLCDREDCVREIEQYEKDRGKKLRDLPRVVFKDDLTIIQMNNKQLKTPLDNTCEIHTQQNTYDYH